MPTSTRPASAIVGSLLVIVAASGFAAKAIFVKLAYAYAVDAVTLLALRMAFSLPFFLLMGYIGAAGAQPRVRLSGSDQVVLIGLGFLGYYLASFLDFLGLEYISASLERLIIFLYPTLVVLFSALFLGKRIGAREGLALVLSYGGILLVFDQANAAMERDVVAGSTLVFASTVCYALYLIGSGEVIAKLGAQRFTAIAMTVACLACLAQFAASRPVVATLVGLPQQVYLLGFGMAILSTVLPALFMSMGIARVGANRAAIIGGIGPIATIGLAYVFLGEVITEIQILGGLAVLVGVLLVSLKPARL